VLANSVVREREYSVLLLKPAAMTRKFQDLDCHADYGMRSTTTSASTGCTRLSGPRHRQRVSYLATAQGNRRLLIVQTPGLNPAPSGRLDDGRPMGNQAGAGNDVLPYFKEKAKNQRPGWNPKKVAAVTAGRAHVSTMDLPTCIPTASNFIRAGEEWGSLTSGFKCCQQ